MWPYRARVIHLLALKDCSEFELLILLQTDGIKENVKTAPRNILCEVANLNSQNSLYSLKDCVYTEIQRDWPGYNELERQMLELVLSKKVRPFPNQESSPGSGRHVTSSPEYELFNSDDPDDFTVREVSISHLTSLIQSTPHSHLNQSTENYTHSTKDSPPSLPPYLPISNPQVSVNFDYNSCSSQETPWTQDPRVHSIIQDNSVFKNHPNKHISSEMSPSLSIENRQLKTVERKCLSSEEKSECIFTEHNANNQNYNIDTM
ncbi:RNA polymerase II elongation factor ELL2 [Fukomys damarensis]|uniref:RNA polymerase II elongation factor ELL2 n=1 Tax=Fukomys damarensis TaxID=885580 RepID=A0A091DM09_FUKDA|nr:RNA polymerase II elongation factor ELL2 [Fukomys damarensis]